MAVRDPNLDKFDHLVVLMLENRSFDALLGYLYDGDRPRTFIGGGDPVFRGVSGLDLANPDRGIPPRLVPVATAPWRTPDDMCQPCPDPGEFLRPHVNQQLYGEDDVDRLPARAPMIGFVRDYERVLRDGGHSATYDDYRKIMHCFPPEATPVTSGLARAFAVSDAWFASVPSQTFCNRSFLVSGQSHGFVCNANYVKWSRNDAPTVFDRLTAALGPGHDWRLYWDPEDVVPVTCLVNPAIDRCRYADRLRPFSEFKHDCRAGRLPAFTLIQPRLIVNHDDMHPPVPINPFVHSSILAGELLVNEVYEAVRHGARWDRTLLVVLFDEHGGSYDHWAPPLGATPPVAVPPYPLEDDFHFDRFGVRVPAIFVSPYVPERAVIRAPGPTPFDHTSVIRTLCRRFDLAPLTDRDRAAPDFAAVLSLPLDRPRPAPTFTPRPYSPVPWAVALDGGLSSLHRDVLGLAACARGISIDGLATVGDVLAALRAAPPSREQPLLSSLRREILALAGRARGIVDDGLGALGDVLAALRGSNRPPER